MRTVYLPESHTDGDLVLAGQVVAALDSSELYVVMMTDGSPATPTVKAAVREVEPPAAGRLQSLWAGLATLLHGIFGPRRPVEREERPALEPASRV